MRSSEVRSFLKKKKQQLNFRAIGNYNFARTHSELPKQPIVQWCKIFQLNKCKKIQMNEKITALSSGEPSKQIFGQSWDFVPTGLTPAPLPKR